MYPPCNTTCMTLSVLRKQRKTDRQTEGEARGGGVSVITLSEIKTEHHKPLVFWNQVSLKGSL